MDAWHYEKDGQRMGPITEDEIRLLIEQRSLAPGTLVWKPGLANWAALATTGLAAHLDSTSVPPALPAARISNVVAWFLALAPILGMTLEAMIGGEIIIKTGQYWWVTLALNIGLGVLDERHLKRAGVDTTRFGKLVVIVPIYLWMRAKSLGQRPTYFWTWIVLFTLSLLAAV